MATQGLSIRIWQEVQAFIDASPDRVGMDEMAAYVYEQFRDELEAEGSALARSWIQQLLTRHMKEAAGDLDAAPTSSGQGVLPGFDLRAYYSVPDESGTVRYIARDRMRLDDWDAHEALLAANIKNAEERYRDHREKGDYVRPFLEQGMTLGETLAELKARQP